MEPAYVLVPIRRQVRPADAAVGSQEPCLEVRESEGDPGQTGLGLLWGFIQHNGPGRVAEFGKAIVALPAIGPDHGAFRHVPSAR